MVSLLTDVHYAKIYLTFSHISIDYMITFNDDSSLCSNIIKEWAVILMYLTRLLVNMHNKFQAHIINAGK